MPDSSTYLRTLTRESQKPEAEIMTMAFQIGLRQMWREHVLGRYLRRKLSRDEAVELVGLDWVDLAERQHQAMIEDLEWALAD
jgi:hypothetical protein